MGEFGPETIEQEPREKCGIAAVYSFGKSLDVGHMAYDLLLPQQHRGYDAAGIFVTGEETVMYADQGKIPEVFPDEAKWLDNEAPNANIALAHNRYATSGEGLMPYMGFAFNGNITNFEQIAQKYGIEDKYANDGMAIGEVLTILTQKFNGDVSDAARELLPQLEGSYSIIASDGKRLIGTRSQQGQKPLFLGRIEDSADEAFAFVSEDVALYENGLSKVKEIEPDQMIVIDETGIREERVTGIDNKKVCLFEIAYNMRPESSYEGKSVYDMRYNTGRQLGKEHPITQADYPETIELANGGGEIIKHEVVVVGVPESSLPAAEGLADEIDARNVPGLVINPNYEGSRSFIARTQEEREAKVRNKFLVNEEKVRDKVVVLEDDSIVRGTTMRVLVKMLREAGAKEVHLRINTPPIKWPCFFGVDMGHNDDLISAKMHPRELAVALDADSVGFLSEQGFAEGVGIPLGQLCMGCVRGVYPTPVPIEEIKRSERQGLSIKWRDGEHLEQDDFEPEAA